MASQSGKQKSYFKLRVDSRNVHECSCLEIHIPRNGHTLCRQNVMITHFVKFVTTVYRRIEQTVKTNASVREFCAPPSKTADSKVGSVTRAEVMLRELIVEQNIPLALLSC